MRFDKTQLCKDVVGILLLLLGGASAHQEIYISHKCSTSGNYTSNGTSEHTEPISTQPSRPYPRTQTLHLDITTYPRERTVTKLVSELCAGLI
ncbi:unnamed protein product [Rhodiola kirilowii]